jgi:FHA domain-containing protein/zinc ribbon protein
MINTKICSSCHTENLPEATICANCGASLVGASFSKTTIRVPENAERLSHPEHIVQLTRLYADIIVFQVLGSDQPIMIKEATKITFGRYNPGETPPTIDLTPYNANLMGVSRQHAVITRSGKNYLVEDLQSTNGTWLNEVKLAPNKPYDIHNGDLIRFGQLAVYCYFRTDEAAPALEEAIRLKHSQGDSQFKLTSYNLETVVTPYLKAISGIQTLSAQLLQQEETEVAVVALTVHSADSQIDIRLAGANQAIKVLKKHVAPWRESNASKIAGLSTQNGSKNQSATNNSEALRRELNDSEQALVAQILADLAPDSPMDERIPYAEKLLFHLHIVNFSALGLV